MIRAVLDPNVLISAFISRRGGAPDQVVRAWRDGAFDLVVSPVLIGELRRVLARPKFALQAAEGRADAYIAAVVRDAVHLGDPRDPPAVSSDGGDDYLFALARSAKATAIVSGDKHLTQVVDPTPPVLTPRQFLQRWL
ncbi:MAG: putative toxin-antitoxin system toxin component, PIN family [Thermoleophilaceae bacterium]